MVVVVVIKVDGGRVVSVVEPELAAAFRVTTIEDEVVVTPSCAVTTTVIVFVPTARGIAADADPDVTVTPFTFTEALLSVTDGVTVNDVVSLETVAEYEVVVAAKDCVVVMPLVDIDANVESDDVASTRSENQSLLPPAAVKSPPTKIFPLD